MTEGGGTVKNLMIGSREQDVDRPVYLPGYIGWEHEVDHHDPVTDVFSLGMILASVACNLDFNRPEDLDVFVSNRRNLFRLHPVLMKAIFWMTELSQHQRPQDLSTILHNLEHYRDQTVDFDFDLAAAAGTGGAKRQVVLSKLRERLFEISRRNRLLHSRATLNAVNLTHASVPLSFDVKSIRPDQILTWQGEFVRSVSAGDPVSLNRYLNFTEQLYLPSVLDRIRADALRDAAEFGFEQLRLAVCFLRWANVKESPPQHYDSPLVLLPVRLVKKKGVRDSYWLQPLTTEAEINPVVRHLFKQLYDIDPPAMIDLSETTVDHLYEDLAKRIAASEPGITLNKVDRPRIELIHDLAKRRLDRYQRSARLSGRGIRNFMDVDYSYDPANFHPLGLAIFRAKIRPAATHLREIVQTTPASRQYMVPPQEGEAVSEKERQFYSLREDADTNPYHWDFDLCRLTLGNFKYRKMTLVRDYADLLEDNLRNPAFDAIFSLAPRPLESEPPKAPTLDDRYHVVSCDPTQAAAIGLARSGTSYIIQGPPGTGKSQTITNLIADYVKQGKRVLFVCEKRAAIDVVYARLRQQGLHQLCCLIHDSQSDKKEFILDLKATYEGLLGEHQDKPMAWARRRLSVLKSIREELEPLQKFEQSMQAVSPSAGVSVHQLLDRAVELSAQASPLSPSEAELLPDYVEWHSNVEVITELIAAIAEVQGDGVLAKHPLSLLKPSLAQEERPIQLIESRLRAAMELLEALLRALAATGAGKEQWQSMKDVSALVEYAEKVEFLSNRGKLDLLDEKSDASKRLNTHLKLHGAAHAAFVQAQESTKHWGEKLPPEDLPLALEQAKQLEGKLLSFLNPAWWRLRKVLRSRYHFDRHTIKPRWSDVLTNLSKEYQAAAALAQTEGSARDDLGVDEPLASFSERVQTTRTWMRQASEKLGSLHKSLAASDQSSEVIGKVIQAGHLARQLQSACGEFLAGFENQSLQGLQQNLMMIEGSLELLPDFLHCLTLLAQLPPKLSAAFRHFPLNARALEAAVVNRCVDDSFRYDRHLNHFTGSVRDGHVDRLAKLSRRWQEANSGAVLEKCRQQFLENIRISSQPAAALTAEQKEFKAMYNRGRRALEHEFGKVMRHKSIRDIVAGDSGAVVNDLKPVWLMSPLSVSDTLPLRADGFDVVIFDEASQVTLEEAVPAVFRAKQTIVVGDEMQLPPTDFFSAKSTDGTDEEGLLLSDEGQVFEYDLSSNSFLNHAAKNLTSRMLGWHYRSRSESLISFSNWAFYQGKLLTVPDQRLADDKKDEILVDSPEQGADNCNLVLERPVSFHFMTKAVYDNRRNRAEADYIAELVRAMLSKNDPPSIGIVAFSEAQQSEIDGALSRLAAQDKAFAERLEAEYEREVDGQYVGLLIKNLENIQGDERDVVIMSICYGHGPDGKMRMNFGPINQSGGEKRLNVAFSRAKHHMAVVSSIRHTDITNEYNDGANCLKTYLHYAAVCSVGDSQASQRILRELAVWKELQRQDEVQHGSVVRQIAEMLERRGYATRVGIGMSHFRCDVAAHRHGDLRYRLGILVDTDSHYQQPDLLEREMLRPQLLRGFGWNIAHVLTRDWYRDRSAVLERLVKLIEQGEAVPEVGADAEEDDAWGEIDEKAEVGESPASASEPQLFVEEQDVPGTPQDSSTPTTSSSGTESKGPPKRYFEFVGGSSRKFWEIAVADNTITVRFGRIGTNGQTQTKVFDKEATATRTALRLIGEKVSKGYREKT